MFTYQQTLQIHDKATEKGLALWGDIKATQLKNQFYDYGYNFDSNKKDLIFWVIEGRKTKEEFSPYLDSQPEKKSIGQMILEAQEFSNYNQILCPNLDLDNLFPWLDEVFGEIENPEFRDCIRANVNKNYPRPLDLSFLHFIKDIPKTITKKLKQQATSLYFSDPQQLADLICKTIINLKN
jgi:hypothetical protein